jgi:thiamine phosphate synthase YjbQ (UPF0047 family)
MRVKHEQLEVRTNGKGTYAITDGIQEKIDKCEIVSGTVTVLFSTRVAV